MLNACQTEAIARRLHEERRPETGSALMLSSPLISNARLTASSWGALL